jgi:N-acyl-phosphatidylethanolamine-hydrolysing phospholipase D
VGLGLGKWFKALGINKVTGMDWWENSTLTLKETGKPAEEKRTTAKITCLPCQHSSGRESFDKDETLWASWAVKSEDKSVWFAGDTGYRIVPDVPKGVDDYGSDFKDLPRCPYFKQIGEFYGLFDLGLIPMSSNLKSICLCFYRPNP